MNKVKEKSENMQRGRKGERERGTRGKCWGESLVLDAQ